MIRWEYDTITDATLQEMNEAGRGGWECYAVGVFVYAETTSTEHYFKRPIEDDELAPVRGFDASASPVDLPSL